MGKYMALAWNNQKKQGYKYSEGLKLADVENFN